MCRCPECGSYDTTYEREDDLTVGGWYCNVCVHGPFKATQDEPESVEPECSDEDAMASAGHGEDESYMHGGGYEE